MQAMNRIDRKQNFDGAWLQGLFNQHPEVKQGHLAAALTEKFGWQESSGNAIVTRMLNGTRTIKGVEIPAILDFFGSPSKADSATSTGERVKLPVFDLTASAGDGSILPLQQQPDSYWDLPAELLPFPIHGKNLAAIQVRGDSMMPELNNGDRVIVDLNDKHPSPSGIFVLDDGMGGVVVKRLELLFHNAPPTIKMISTNSLYTPYEVGLDQVTISGRVILKIGKV